MEHCELPRCLVVAIATGCRRSDPAALHVVPAAEVEARGQRPLIGRAEDEGASAAGAQLEIAKRFDHEGSLGYGERLRIKSRGLCRHS